MQQVTWTMISPGFFRSPLREVSGMADTAMLMAMLMSMSMSMAISSVVLNSDDAVSWRIGAIPAHPPRAGVKWSPRH